MPKFLEKIEKFDAEVPSCVCERKTSVNFYNESVTKKAMSPSKIDVFVGLGLYAALVIASAFILPPIAPLFIFGFTLTLILLLGAGRMLLRHSILCALRWGSLQLFGLGRWLSF